MNVIILVPATGVLQISIGDGEEVLFFLLNSFLIKFKQFLFNLKKKIRN